jgi:hypothetical protein
VAAGLEPAKRSAEGSSEVTWHGLGAENGAPLETEDGALVEAEAGRFVASGA